MIILGINAYHPDASVALLRDGRLIWAAEEERFNRIKHSSGFPALALKKCLEETNTPPAAIDAVAISKNPRANFLRKISWVLKNKPERQMVLDRVKAFRASSQFEKDFFAALHTPPTFLKARFVHVEHHEAHVASAFFMSGFERSAFLSLDGLGDFSSAMWGVGAGSNLNVLGRVFFPHSAGFLYTAATQFLGFTKFGDEYKVMGLAAYGEPIYLETFRHMYRLRRNGQFELNLNYFTHHEGHAKIRWEGGAPEQDIMFSKHWEDKFGRPRLDDEPVNDRDKNIAASLQAALEEIYLHVLNHLYKETKEKNLCLAGGVAFNSLANGKIKKNTPFENIYIPPAAGDAGTALGAAAFVAYNVMKAPRGFVMNHAYFGTEASEKEIEVVLKEKFSPHSAPSQSLPLHPAGGGLGWGGGKGEGEAAFHYEKLAEEALIQKTVEDLAAGKIVGWFQGRMEFGPRALGSRSILADPRKSQMKDILNKRIKHRETFRPFAPAVPEEHAKEFFEMDCDSSPFMLKVFPVKPKKKSVIPAVTHVDGTARVQTVSKETNPLFWKLLNAFGKKTGVPVLLNTSFNENEPIVCTPREAVDCFLKTKMDVLVMGAFYIEKR